MASDRLKIRLRLTDYEAKTEVIMPYCNQCDKLTCAALCRDSFPDEYYKTIKFCDCGKLADIVVTPPVSQIKRKYSGAWIANGSIPESSQTETPTKESAAKKAATAKDISSSSEESDSEAEPKSLAKKAKPSNKVESESDSDKDEKSSDDEAPSKTEKPKVKIVLDHCGQFLAVCTGTCLLAVELLCGQFLAREGRITLGESILTDDRNKKDDLVPDRIICMMSGADEDLRLIIPIARQRSLNNLQERRRLKGMRLEQYRRSANYFSRYNTFKRIRYSKYDSAITSKKCAIEIYKCAMEKRYCHEFGGFVGGKGGLWRVEIAKRPVSLDEALVPLRYGRLSGMGTGSKAACTFLRGGAELPISLSEQEASRILAASIVKASFEDNCSGGRIRIDFLPKGEEKFRETYNKDSISAYYDTFDRVRNNHAVFVLIERVRFTGTVELGFSVENWVRGLLDNSLEPYEKLYCNEVTAKEKFKFYRVQFPSHELVNDFMDRMNGNMETVLNNFVIPEGFQVGTYVNFPDLTFWVMAAQENRELLLKMKDMVQP